jgi:hypothetical protein
MKMYKLFSVLCFMTYCIFTTMAQNHIVPSVAPTDVNYTSSGVQRTALLAHIDALPSIDTTWMPLLTREGISPNESEDDDSLQYYKALSATRKDAYSQQNNKGQPQETVNSPTGIEPYVNFSFQGNPSSGCPNDNTLAISNAGMIVSCVNSNICIYNSASVLQRSISLYDFYNYFTGFSLPSSICDPKVIYDPVADRFILFSQVCDQIAANSKILIAFSQTNNPNNGWWLYWFSGNPLNDRSWFDYPRMGLSNNELYVTGNLYREQSAGGGYNQSIIYQINKNDGYNGVSIRNQYRYNIPGQPFTILPLSKGQAGAYRQGCYFVATQSGGGGNTIKFYDLTDDLTNTTARLNYYSIPTYPYQVSANARQLGNSQLLDVGDCRMMDGFYHNGVAHYTFTVDSAGWSSIRYYRMPISTLAVPYFQSSYAGTFDYSYPALASFTTSATDQSALLVFLSSGASTYATIRAKSFDNNWNTQESIIVKTGLNYVNRCFDNNRNANRWGDYTGISRSHSTIVPRIWLGASFANANNAWGTWIAEIGSRQNSVPTNEVVKDLNAVSVYPNPVAQERVSVSFSTTTAQLLQFRLLSIDGRWLNDIEKKEVLAGTHNFSFNVGHLPNGNYILSIVNKENQVLHNGKIQISH